MDHGLDLSLCRQDAPLDLEMYGNPYMAGKYGGAAFILIYLVFLVLLGLPVTDLQGDAGTMTLWMVIVIVVLF